MTKRSVSGRQVVSRYAWVNPPTPPISVLMSSGTTRRTLSLLYSVSLSSRTEGLVERPGPPPGRSHLQDGLGDRACGFPLVESRDKVCHVRIERVST